MPNTFSADELFQIAMELEEMGQLFYEALAASAGDVHMVDLFHRLVAQEAEHYRKFKRLREEYAGRRKELTLEEREFAQKLLNSRVIPNSEEARRMARSANASKALDLAIEMEENSIAFYRELTGGVEPKDRDTLRQIIQEEQAHVVTLRNAKKQT
jgi:rubrerythrin